MGFLKFLHDAYEFMLFCGYRTTNSGNSCFVENVIWNYNGICLVICEIEVWKEVKFEMKRDNVLECCHLYHTIVIFLRYVFYWFFI